MPIQAPQWTEFLSCPVCCNEFAANLRPPISLGCGHTICRTCLATLHHRQCPFDQTVISTDLDYLPINNALLQLVSTPGSASSSSAYGVKRGGGGGGGGITEVGEANKSLGNGGIASPEGGSSQGAVCGSSSSSTSSSSSSTSSTSSSSSSSTSSNSSSSALFGAAASNVTPNASSAIDPDLNSTSVQSLSPENLQCYKTANACIEELALYLKPCPSSSGGGGGGLVAGGGGVGVGCTVGGPSGASLLSRQMQRKLVILVNCQLIEDEGRARSLRAARSLGERTVMELILHHQNPQQLSTNLWAAVRARGCQFLGPAMQEEVLKLVLLALEDGSALSRKVLVMFVVQRLEPHFSQASKTSIGHVVQLLYRASCFKVSKREGDSSLMQLKEEFRTYEALRREHDAQIVQIATEAGLRIAPDQWSSLLYGDTAHKSHMQSINDKLQTPQSFVQSVQELIIALQRTGDPANLSGLRVQLKHLAAIDWNSESHVPSWSECSAALQAVKRVVAGLVHFVQHHGNRKLQEAGHLAHNRNYKISLCRDLNNRGTCPRGTNCTFAHSDEELEKYRTKLRKNHGGGGGGGSSSATGGTGGTTPNLRMMPNGKELPGTSGLGQQQVGSSRARSGLDFHHGPTAGSSNGDGGTGGSLHQNSSSSHGGYHSSGEEASSSPVRYQKPSSVGGGVRESAPHNHRMLDKGGSHIGGQPGGSTNGSGGPHHGSYGGPGNGPMPMNGGGTRSSYGVGGGNSTGGHYQHGAGGVGGSMNYPHPNRGPPGSGGPQGPGGPPGGGAGAGGGGHHNSPQPMRYRPPPHIGSGAVGVGSNTNGGGGSYHPGGPGVAASSHANMLHHPGNGGHHPGPYPGGTSGPGPGGAVPIPPAGPHHTIDPQHNHGHHGPPASNHPPYFAGGEYPEGSKHGSDHGPPHLPHHHGHNHPAQSRRPPNYAGWDGMGSTGQHHMGPHHGGVPPGKVGSSQGQQQQQQHGANFGMAGGPGQPHHPPSGPYGGSPKNGHTPPVTGPMGPKYMGGMQQQGGGQQQNYHHQKTGPGTQSRDFKEKHHGGRLPPGHLLPPHGHGLPPGASPGGPSYPGGRNGTGLHPSSAYLSSPLPMAGGPGDGMGKSASGPLPPSHHNGHNGSQTGYSHHHQQHQQHMNHAPSSYQQRQTIADSAGYLPKMIFDALGSTGVSGKKSYNQQLMNQHLNDIGMPNPAAAAAAAANKDMFIRSDSLLADDDALLVAEPEFSPPYGAISRMNPIGTERIDLGLMPRGHLRLPGSGHQQRGLWSTLSSSLGGNTSPTGGGGNGGSSSTSSPFYPGSNSGNVSAQPLMAGPMQQHHKHPMQQPHLPYHTQQQQQQQHHRSASSVLGKMAPEPNNNTLDFDLVRADKKALEYESSGAVVDCCESASGTGNVEPDYLLQSLVSPTALVGSHYGQQQQPHFQSMVAGSVLMMGDRSDSPRLAQQQQQLLSKGSDRCNGGPINERLSSTGSALSPACANDDQRKLNDIKSPQSSLSGMQSPASVMIMSMTSESSACTTPPLGGSTVPGGTGSMWNNLLDLNNLKSLPLEGTLNDPNELDGCAGRTNGGTGYGMAFKFPNMLIDSAAGQQQQQQQQNFLGQHSNGSGSVSTGDALSEMNRFHEMLNVTQPASPSRASDRTANEEPRKIGTFNELNDLRIHPSSGAGLQPASAVILTSVTTASSSPSVVSSTGGSDQSTGSSLWNGCGLRLDLSSLKPAGLDQAAAVVTNEADGVASNSCNSNSTTSTISGLMNTSNGSSCEDSYEAGIADDMRELELRLESVLQLDENGI